MRTQKDLQVSGRKPVTTSQDHVASATGLSDEEFDGLTFKLSHWAKGQVSKMREQNEERQKVEKEAARIQRIGTGSHTRRGVTVGD